MASGTMPRVGQEPTTKQVARMPLSRYKELKCSRGCWAGFLNDPPPKCSLTKGTQASWTHKESGPQMDKPLMSVPPHEQKGKA